MKRTWLGLLVVVVLGGCSASHGDGDGGVGGDSGGGGEDAGRCFGPPPDCYVGWGGSSGCCLPEATPGTCVGEGFWICDGDTFEASECGRFDSVCEGIDAGPPPPPPIATWLTCGDNTECTLTPNTCCGTCAVPTLDDVAAVNIPGQPDYYLEVACPEAGTEPPPCPRCAVQPNPNLLATCSAGACQAVDIGLDPALTGCTTNEECVVRARSCCECGADVGVSNLVAIHRDARGLFESLVCDRDATCTECAPVYPDDVSATCNAGTCALVGMSATP